MATTVTLKPNAIDISGSTSGTTTLQATAVAGTTTLTLPAATDTLVGKATTDTLTNKTLTGAVMNGTLGATTPSTASVTTLTTSSTVTHNGGTANGVPYLNGSKVLTTGSDLVFDGTNLGVGVTPSTFTGLGAKVFESDGGATAYRGATSGVEQYTNTYFSGGFLYKAGGYATRFTTATGAFTWYTAPSGTAGTAITFTQAMTLNANGALALQGASTSANGVGITFPATQSASTDANTLDDYEEGTWTPSLGGNTTYSTQQGSYTKIGRIVYVAGRIDVTTLGTGSNSTISGLPFTSKASNQEQGLSVGYFGNLAVNTTFLAPRVINNSTTITTVGIASSGATMSAVNIFGNSTILIFSGCYEVA